MVYQKQLVVVLAPAKLNLSLDVAGLLPNGYHDLDMVMQTIALYERITLRRSADLTLRLPGSFVPPNDKIQPTKRLWRFSIIPGCWPGWISQSRSMCRCGLVWRAAVRMLPVCWLA